MVEQGGAGSLFGRYVIDCAGRRAGADFHRTGIHITSPGRLVQALRQSKIGQVRKVIGIEEDVAGLEIAVQNAMLVSEIDGAGDLCEQPDLGL